MWYPATVTEPPAAEPVTLEQVKQQCRIAPADTSNDAHLTHLIASARAHVENYCGIRLVTQAVTMKCTCFGDFERLPEAPIQSVSSIEFVDAAGADQAIADTVFEVRNEGLAPSIVLNHAQHWPSVRPGSRIAVTAVAGFEAVPADIVSAILMIVGKQFAFSREDLLLRSEEVEGIGTTQWAGAVEVTAAVDKAAQILLEPYRCWALT